MPTMIIIAKRRNNKSGSLEAYTVAYSLAIYSYRARAKVPRAVRSPNIIIIVMCDVTL